MTDSDRLRRAPDAALARALREIAAAMAYDLRWVYRLHQRGLAAAESA